MRLLKTTLFLLLCCLAATGQAQDNPRFDLYRWHVKPGQQQALIDYIAKVDVKYQAASNRGWEFYQYEDNTLEVITPLRDYAELDRLKAQYNYAWGSLSEAERKTIYDPSVMAKMVTGTESMILEEQPAMSYAPAGEEDLTNQVTALLLERFTYAYGDWEKVKAHNKELLEKMRAAGSPLRMDIVTMDYGNGQTFEVEYLGTDRADLDRRLSEHQRLLAGPEYDAWLKKAGKLATRVHATFGTKVTTLGQDAKPSTYLLFAVSNNQLLPGKAAAYEAACETANKHLRAADADLYWMTSILDDGMVRHFHPIRQMSDLDKVYEQMRKRRYQIPSEHMAKVMGSFEGLSSTSYVSVMRNHTDLGFLRNKIDGGPASAVYKIQAYDYNPDDRKKVMAFLEKTKTMLAVVGGNSPYEVWSYEMGGPDNRIFIVEYGKDKAGIEAEMASDFMKMGTERDGWMKEATGLLNALEATYGHNSIRASYLPEGMK
jgi:hypothetical protein